MVAVSVAVKLGAYVLGLVLVFGAAWGVGGLTGTSVPGAAAEPHGAEADGGPEGHGEEEPAAGMEGMAEGGSELPAGGLMISDRGYGLALASPTLTGGPATTIEFQVTGPDGDPVQEFDTAHDKKMHLIVVRRDMTGFQHVHPELGDDGTWSTDLALEPGAWRVFADFVPSDLGENLTLGADLTVPGELSARPLPEQATSTEVDGYTVSLDGDLVAGEESKVTLSVTKGGEPVTDLEPYLGAYGHLVTLRAGDLAYLHVHPEGEPGDGKTPAGPGVVFYAEVPSAGDYRLFLDFKHDDVVRTAELTVHSGEDEH